MATKRPDSNSQLFPQMYRELHRVAGAYLRRERRNHTLQPTALVNEAWIRIQKEKGNQWQGRTHGLAIAAQAMRRLLIDHGRHQKRDKRGGGADLVRRHARHVESGRREPRAVERGPARAGEPSRTCYDALTGNPAVEKP